MGHSRRSLRPTGKTRRGDAAEAKGNAMRIRWTTRIATAVGIITLIAGIAAGGPARAAAAKPTASASHTAVRVAR
jgi:hypothetical protein